MSGSIYDILDYNKEGSQEDSDQRHHSEHSSQSLRPTQDSTIGSTLNLYRSEHSQTWCSPQVRPKIAKPPHQHYLENPRRWTHLRSGLPFRRRKQANRHEDETGARDVQAERRSEAKV